MFPTSFFPVTYFTGSYFPPGGGSVQQIPPPVIPLPSVTGYDAPDRLYKFELEDERAILEMIKLFLKGQN